MGVGVRVVGALGGVPPEAAPRPRLRAAGAMRVLVARVRLDAAARAGVRVAVVRLVELVAGRARGMALAAGVVGVAGAAGVSVAGVAVAPPLEGAGAGSGVAAVGVADAAAGGARLPAPAAGVDPAVVEPVRAEGAVRVRRAMGRTGEGSGSVLAGR
ncbi:hypothetical protein NZK33_11745 [Cyanobium sp. FGCU-6]|nr:hypothetical protein [Cyanobium sp. FGCU6]